MYLERIKKHFKIVEKIGNPLTEGQIESLWIKGISNASIMKERDTLNLSVELNQRIERTIGTLGF